VVVQAIGQVVQQGSAHDTGAHGERRNAHGQAEEVYVDGPDYRSRIVQAAGEISRNGLAAAANSDGVALRVEQLTGEHPCGAEPVGHQVEPVQAQPTGHRPHASAGGTERPMDLGLAVQGPYWGWLPVPMTLWNRDNGHLLSSGLSVVAFLLKEMPSGGLDDAARA